MEKTPSLPAARIDFFNRNGYLAVEQIITPEEIDQYRELYDAFLNGDIDTGMNRSDLGTGIGQNKDKENITQIMWPSDFVPDILQKAYHRRALTIARQLQGEDLDMDFDMLIDKAPFSRTPTPWHQDAAYWMSLPDKRAVSCWLALDDASLDNGCMWYVPGSHLLPVRPHGFAGGKGSALTCQAGEDEGTGVEVKAGSCIFHHGHTLHYSRGNNTATHRRAYIINFRPAEMIAQERAGGFDHGRNGNAGDRQIRNEKI